MQCRLLSQPENFLSSGHRPGEFPVRNPAGWKGLSAVFHKSYPECRVSLRSVPDRQIRTGLCRLLFRCCFLQEIKHFFLCMEQRLTEHLRTEEFFTLSHFLFNRLPAWIFCSSFQADGTEVPTAGKLSAADGWQDSAVFPEDIRSFRKPFQNAFFGASGSCSCSGCSFCAVTFCCFSVWSGSFCSAVFLLPAHFLSHFPPSGARTLLPGGSFSAAVSMFPVMPRKAESAPPASVPHTRPSARQLRKATILFRSLLRRQIPLLLSEPAPGSKRKKQDGADDKKHEKQ